MKQASKTLLASLQELLKTMPDWTQNTTTQAEVRVFILDILWQALPRPPLTDAETRGSRRQCIWLCLAAGSKS